jgi:hypothetical protein
MFLLLGSHFFSIKLSRIDHPIPAPATLLRVPQPTIVNRSPRWHSDQASTLEMVYRVGNGVSAPQELYAPVPEFPEKPPRNGRSRTGNGQTLARGTSEGRVRDLKVIESTSQDLRRLQWRQ